MQTNYLLLFFICLAITQSIVMAEEKEESIQAGCSNVVTKPLDRTIVMEIIDSYFKKA